MKHADQIDGWFKSTYSGSSGGACVEVSVLPEGVAMRDSKDPTGPALIFTAAEWAAFLAGAAAGQFDLA